MRRAGALSSSLPFASISSASKAPAPLAQAAVNGIRYSQVFNTDKEVFSLTKLTADAYSPDDLPRKPPNTMWFTRDPASVIGEGVTLNHMYWPERNREVIAYKTIFLPITQISARPLSSSSMNRLTTLKAATCTTSTAKNIAVGISQRTEPAAIDTLANNLLWDENSTIESVWAIQVPYDDLCIHLDTYFHLR